MMPTRTRKVVVVDDDDSMREAIGRVIEATGFESAVYASAEALLADRGWVGADAVVTDIRLSGMSGLDLLARLRERGADVPVVLITAHDAPGLREDALGRGAAGYLAKPFRGTRLLAMVRALIGAAEAR